MKNGLVMSLLVVLVSPFLFLPGGAGQEKKKPKTTMSKGEKLLVDLTNEARKKQNLPALKTNPTLIRVARAHSENMAKKQKLAHVLDGKTAFQRIKSAGYLYRTAGENVGWAFSEKQLFGGWMKSKLHRANILKRSYTEIGIGQAVDKKGAMWYTQVFASPLRRR